MKCFLFSVVAGKLTRLQIFQLESDSIISEISFLNVEKRKPEFLVSKFFFKNLSCMDQN